MHLSINMWILIGFSRSKTVYSDFDHRQTGIAAEAAALNTPQYFTNVIVVGSSPFTRSLTTADSKCQPLFICVALMQNNHVVPLLCHHRHGPEDYYIQFDLKFPKHLDAR